MNFSSPYVDLPQRLTVRENLEVYAPPLRCRQARAPDRGPGRGTGPDRIPRATVGPAVGRAEDPASCSPRRWSTNPTSCLLDEPTASLDPDSADWIRTYLERYQARRQATILLASHNMAEVERLAGDVLMMKRGRIGRPRRPARPGRPLRPRRPGGGLSPHRARGSEGRPPRRNPPRSFRQERTQVAGQGRSSAGPTESRPGTRSPRRAGRRRFRSGAAPYRPRRRRRRRPPGPSSTKPSSPWRSPPVPVEASSALRAIAAVSAAWRSTAPAIAAPASVIARIVSATLRIAATASPVTDWMVATWSEISCVALAVWPARVLTSPATTAKPLPASPARAASIVALSARRLVRSAMSEIRRTTSPIVLAALSSPATVRSACSASPAARSAMSRRPADRVADLADCRLQALRRLGNGADGSRGLGRNRGHVGHPAGRLVGPSGDGHRRSRNRAGTVGEMLDRLQDAGLERLGAPDLPGDRPDHQHRSDEAGFEILGRILRPVVHQRAVLQIEPLVAQRHVPVDRQPRRLGQRRRDVGDHRRVVLRMQQRQRQALQLPVAGRQTVGQAVEQIARRPGWHRRSGRPPGRRGGPKPAAGRARAAASLNCRRPSGPPG